MKPVSITASVSPPLAASSAGVTKSAPQLPISRSNNSTWEKPERARTSHACEPCRERKTKCDGERPSCRRCSHTGTSCHYGYGKGWRKRKTAEDLTATSRRLARYEALLAEILPMVSTEVRELIEDARDQDAANSNGSETNETEQGYPSMPSLTSESTMSSSSSRLLLPLPVPSPLTAVSTRITPSPGTFDSVSPPTVIPISTGPTPAPGIPSSQSRPSIDAGMLPRLPSITPDGQLIDPNSRELSPPKLQRLSEANTDFASERLGMLTGSPKSQTSSGMATKLQRSPG